MNSKIIGRVFLLIFLAIVFCIGAAIIIGTAQININSSSYLMILGSLALLAMGLSILALTSSRRDPQKVVQEDDELEELIE